jgi:hypothetical protein
MKTNKVLLLALLGNLLFIESSCVKSASGSATSTGSADSSAVFTATIDGVNWQADSVSAVLNQLYFPEEVKVLTITGYSSTKRIIIECTDTSLAGSNDSTISLATYAEDSLSRNAVFEYFSRTSSALTDTLWGQGGLAIDGSATISSSDGIKKKVSGSFQFSARLFLVDSMGIDTAGSTVAITNGVFKHIPYTLW